MTICPNFSVYPGYRNQRTNLLLIELRNQCWQDLCSLHIMIILMIYIVSCVSQYSSYFHNWIVLLNICLGFHYKVPKYDCLLFYSISCHNSNIDGCHMVLFPSRQPIIHTLYTSFSPAIRRYLAKGPYLPCGSMAGRAPLAGYHRIVRGWIVGIMKYLYSDNGFNWFNNNEVLPSYVFNCFIWLSANNYMSFANGSDIYDSFALSDQFVLQSGF